MTIPVRSADRRSHVALADDCPPLDRHLRRIVALADDCPPLDRHLWRIVALADDYPPLDRHLRRIVALADDCPPLDRHLRRIVALAHKSRKSTTEDAENTETPNLEVATQQPGPREESRRLTFTSPASLRVLHALRDVIPVQSADQTMSCPTIVRRSTPPPMSDGIYPLRIRTRKGQNVSAARTGRERTSLLPPCTSCSPRCPSPSFAHAAPHAAPLGQAARRALSPSPRLLLLRAIAFFPLPPQGPSLRVEATPRPPTKPAQAPRTGRALASSRDPRRARRA